MAGCTGPNGVTVVEPHPRVGRQPNLALGPSREHARLGQELAVRSDWPAATIGVRGEDVTFYSTIIYDQQSYNDRYNSFYHETQTIRTGVLIR